MRLKKLVMKAKQTRTRKMSDLARGLRSAESVADIDAELADILEDYAALLELREIAAKASGVTTPPPVPPISPIRSSGAPAREARQNNSGTIESLVRQYLADDRSPYRNVRHATKSSYDRLIKRVRNDHGAKRLADLKTDDIQGFFDEWTKSGLPMARSLITMLRGLVNFGVKIKDPECERLSAVLHYMQFEMAETRKEQLTVEHAKRIIEKAHEAGLPMIALTQAIQFEWGLRQKDVIGEWVPELEFDWSDIFSEDRQWKWLRGIRWDQIDSNLILHHITSMGLKEIERDLKRTQMVADELERRWPGCMQDRSLLPESGPIIRYEKKGLSYEDSPPYEPDTFRLQWRKCADAAGVPRNVFNRDSRPRGREQREERENDRPVSADLQPTGLIN